MFDDVIRWLLIGLGQQTKAEKKWVEEHPLRLPTDDEQIRRAVKLIEAADAIWMSDMMAYQGGEVREGMEALLNALFPDECAALPDAPKEEK